jgi:hypothetical protein
MFPASRLYRSAIASIVAASFAGPALSSPLLTAECLVGEAASIKKHCCCRENCHCGTACHGCSQDHNSPPLPTTPARDLWDLAKVSASHSAFAIELGIAAHFPAVDAVDSVAGTLRTTLLAQHTILRV